MMDREILLKFLREGDRCLSWNRSKRELLVKAVERTFGDLQVGELIHAYNAFTAEVLTPGALPAARNRLLEIAWDHSDAERKRLALDQLFRERLGSVIRAKLPAEMR